MQDGFSGSIALVSGRDVASKEAAESSDSLIPLQNGACSVINDNRISATERLYFAVNHRLPNANFKNGFIAVQVLRFVPAQSASSDVALTRSGAKWHALDTPQPIGGLQTDMLHIDINDFVSAHTLIDGKFDEAKIQKLFAHTLQGKVIFHGRLPKQTGSKKPAGYYSSLDPGLSVGRHADRIQSSRRSAVCCIYEKLSSLFFIFNQI